MITNERQYRITKAQLAKLSIAAESLDTAKRPKAKGAGLLARAEQDALQSEIENLRLRIAEYEALKAGAVISLKASTLEELPRILIQGRIAKGLSQRELAQALGMKAQQIQRYESEEYASASLQRLTEVAKALGLSISEVAELQKQTEGVVQSKERDFAWHLFPVKDMYTRNWFEGFTGSLTAALTNAEMLVQDFVAKTSVKPAAAFLRQRVRLGSTADRYSVLAWQCRVIGLSNSINVKKKYTRSAIPDNWLEGLAKLSRYDDGPRRAKDYLSETGIVLVVEPHLPQTHLDGAALLRHDGVPTVGLTLRYDRLDNFWFVLVHELIHVLKDLREGHVEGVFDDVDFEPDELEKETDRLAGNALIPNDKWETALARYIRSEDSIREFAGSLKIAPAIVAGRIRKEADNYTILGNMIGLGEVRKHFPDVHFSQ